MWDLQQSSEFANTVSSGTFNIADMLHSKQSIYSPEFSGLLSSCFFSGFVKRTDLLWLLANCQCGQRNFSVGGRVYSCKSFPHACMQIHTPNVASKGKICSVPK